jgi:SAM-dependent methyltransferase
VSDDPRERFTGAAELYEKYRPSYPSALVDWILAAPGIPGAGDVVDVGCGTGISTRLFAERGFSVVGVDPNDAMLGRARGAGGASRYARGEAAATGLPAQCADLVTVAQAFHWFDIEATLAEFRRILRPSGCCAVFWNVRDLAAPFVADYDRALIDYSSEYHVVEEHEKTIERLARMPGLIRSESTTLRHEQELDLQGLEGLAYSSSYVLHGVADRHGFDRRLAEVFARHAREGRVRFLYRTIALRFGLTR